MSTDRSARGQLQVTIGELGHVHAYRWSPDPRHRYTGWWMTPAPAADGCDCEACTAARGGTDCYLGAVTRTAIFDATVIAQTHHPARAAA